MKTSSPLLTVLIFGLLGPLNLLAQDDEVKSTIAVSYQQDQEYWVGQQITLNLDLKTTGFSFSNTHISLPEVSGAFLMQTDTTTIKLTENIDGNNWQIVRYPLALYPQQAGSLKIPSIHVRFNTSAGFGNAEKAFEFQTEVLEVMVKLPSGVRAGDLVVTTRSFELEHIWHPETGTRQVGDALTLTVSRHADDISAMLLPPLPVYRTNGLAAYPQTPVVNDRTRRGDLTGERNDSIIWVVEQAGSYTIPAIRFKWWDPDSQSLKQQLIPGMTLDILPLLTDKATATTFESQTQSNNQKRWQWLLVLSALIAIASWVRHTVKTTDSARSREKAAFAELQKACKTNQPNQTWSALHRWIDASSTVFSAIEIGVSLSGFSFSRNDDRLNDEFLDLQYAMINRDSDWQGRRLGQSLRRIRTAMVRQKTVQSSGFATQLTPGRSG